MILITSSKHNFRRAGMAHPKGTTEYPDGQFTRAELAALKAEPMLTVHQVKDAPTEKKTAGKGK